VKHIIYIQRDDRGEIFDDFVFAAYLGFKQRKFNIKFFKKIDEVPISKNNLIVGSIENTEIYFNKLGINIPPPIHMPKELEDLSGRKTYITTLGEVRKYDEKKFPLFIKSNTELKKFIPGPIKSKKDLGIYLYNISDETSVLISDVINFISEYRCFVKEKQLKGIKHYIGNFDFFPDMEYIYECIRNYKSSPIAYTLDVGITDKGDTVIIECNDAWSIGNYGLDGYVYSELLLSRWIEIIK